MTAREEIRATIYATTDDEGKAAAIAQRLLDAGLNATTADVAELLYGGFPLRSSYRYAVLLFGKEGEIISYVENDR